MPDHPARTGDKASHDTISASEFARNFGYYRVQAHRSPVAVSSHGRIAGYFLAPEDFEEYVRMKAQRHSFATEELDDATVEAVSRARMDPRHDHLNALLDEA